MTREENKNHIKSDSCYLYGLDIHDENLTPEQVRDALVKCFLSAHDKILEDLKGFGDFPDEGEIEKFKSLDVRILIKRFFEEVGGDYDRPDKESLFRVVEKLADFSSSFRKNEIIEKHSKEMSVLISKL